jgi:hypothetical protein
MPPPPLLFPLSATILWLWSSPSLSQQGDRDGHKTDT